MDKDKLREFIEKEEKFQKVAFSQNKDDVWLEGLKDIYNNKKSISEAILNFEAQQLFFLAKAVPEVVKYYHWGMMSTKFWVELIRKYPEIKEYINWRSLNSEQIVEIVQEIPELWHSSIGICRNRLRFNQFNRMHLSK